MIKDPDEFLPITQATMSAVAEMLNIADFSRVPDRDSIRQLVTTAYTDLALALAKMMQKHWDELSPEVKTTCIRAGIDIGTGDTQSTYLWSKLTISERLAIIESPGFSRDDFFSRTGIDVSTVQIYGELRGGS